MKKAMFLVMMLFVTQWVAAQSHEKPMVKPSGVFSMNGQQTVSYDLLKPIDIYYMNVDEYLTWLKTGQLPVGIVNFNCFRNPVTGEVTRVLGRSYFESNRNKMQSLAKASFEKQLRLISQATNNSLGANPSVDDPKIVSFLKQNMTMEFVTFHLAAGEMVNLQGIKGDWTGTVYVAHKNADGFYFVFHVNGQKFLGPRVSCANATSDKELLEWLANGKATIQSNTSQNDAMIGDALNPIGEMTPDQDSTLQRIREQRRLFVNGQRVPTSGTGDTYIVINNNNNSNASVGNVTATAKGGSSNNVISNVQRTPNPQYTGGNGGQNFNQGSAPFIDANPSVMYNPNAMVSQNSFPNVVNQVPYNNRPNVGLSFNLGLGGFGFNNGFNNGFGGGFNNGFGGGMCRPTPVGMNNWGWGGGRNTCPPPVVYGQPRQPYNPPVHNPGGFVPNGTGILPNGSVTNGGGFQSNGTGISGGFTNSNPGGGFVSNPTGP